MKTKMKYLVGMALFLFIAMGVNAQRVTQTPTPLPTQTVPAGETKNYSVTAHPGYLQTWSITAPVNSNVLTSSGNTARVVWNSPGTYFLNLTEANNTNAASLLCDPFTNILQVNVLGAYLKFSSLTTQSCSEAAESLPLTFSSDAAGTVAAIDGQFPLVVKYDVIIRDKDGNDLTTNSREETFDETEKANLVLPLTTTDRADRTDWNPSYTIKVVIISAKAANDFVVTVDTDNDEHVNTVFDKPEANPINMVD